MHQLLALGGRAPRSLSRRLFVPQSRFGRTVEEQHVGNDSPVVQSVVLRALVITSHYKYRYINVYVYLFN